MFFYKFYTQILVLRQKTNHLTLTYEISFSIVTYTFEHYSKEFAIA